jgi:hypothetical protein
MTPTRTATPPPETASQRPVQTPAQTPAQTPPASPPATTEAVLLLRLPIPGNVLVDGVDRGQKANWRESIRPGQHSIRIARDGYAPIDTNITFVAGDTVRVTLTLVARP